MFDINRSIYDDGNNEVDSDRAAQYVHELSEEFADSPEAKALDVEHRVAWAPMMMQYSLDYLGCTPPRMSLADFKEVVFDLFPRKVSTEPEKSQEIIAELRAFWRFLQRRYDLPNAPEVLAELDNDAAARLRNKLADPSNYGMAKSFFMLGTQVGFDMTTQEGLDAFMLAYNANLLANKLSQLPSQSNRLDTFLALGPTSGRPRGQELEDKRLQRKKQRQARKRNRK